MGIASEGQILIAFNIVSYSSIYIVYPPYPFAIPSEIRLVVVRDANPDHRDYSTYKLVDIPSASECYMHIDDLENIYLFWFDQRTGRTQLYMKYLARPGISLEIDPYDWADARSIRPNQTKVLPLHLRNVGSVELDATIYVESNASIEWDLQLSDYRAHLGVFGAVPINLSVFCPPSARFGECVEVWVNATTSDRDYASRVRLLIFVEWRRELKVDCRPTFHLVDPGGKATYRVALENAGDLAEAVQMMVRGIGPPGWSVAPGDLNLTIGVGGVRFIDVTVTAPADAYADEAHVAQLDFLWEDGIVAAPRLILRTVVRPSFFVTLDINRTSAILRPGEVAAFCLTVGNAGDLPGKAYIEVSTLTDPGDWMIVLSQETAALGPGMSEVIELLVGAPADAHGGDIMVVRVRAYCPNPFSEVTADARAEVMHLLSFATDISGLRWDILPATSAPRSLNITSLGNLLEVVGFRLDGLEPGWSWWLKSGGTETQTVTVGPNGAVQVDVWLRAAAGAAAGRHLLRLSLEAEGVTVGLVDVEANVVQVRELSVTMGPIRDMVYPGGHIEMTVEVRNGGNGPDVVALCATAPDIADMRFIIEGADASSIWIPQGGSRSMLLWAHLSDGATVGKSVVQVIAVSTESTVTVAHATAGFSVVSPTVTVSRVELEPTRPKGGEIVAVKVVLYNPGPLGVINVTVTMAGTEPERIASIPADGNVTTTFVWIATNKRSVTLQGQVIFGPGNHTVPWSKTLDLEGGKSSQFWRMTVFAMVTVAMLVVISVMLFCLKNPKINVIPRRSKKNL